MPDTPHKIVRLEDLNNAKKLRLALADLFNQVRGRRILDARRRRTAKLIAFGFTMTVLTLLADLGGYLRAPENWLYDQRCYYFQYNFPRPTESLVHLDIDDNVIAATGKRWPWSRDYQARVIREINLARPRVLYLDVMYSEAAENLASDQNLSAAMREGGTAVSAVSVFLGVTPPHTELYRKVQDYFRGTAPIDDPIASGFAVRIRQAPRDVALSLKQPLLGKGEPSTAFISTFVAAREDVLRDLVDRVLDRQPQATEEDVRAALLGRGGRGRIGNIQQTIFEVYDLARRVLALKRFEVPIPRSVSGIVAPSVIVPPTLPIAQAVSHAAFVDYIPSAEGDAKIRSVPLFINVNGEMLPNAGLTIACAYLGVTLDKLDVSTRRVVIPLPGREPIVIPVHALEREGAAPVQLVADIPWFGSHQWEYTYDVPHHVERKQHLSVIATTDILFAEDNIRNNVGVLRDNYAAVARYAETTNAEDRKNVDDTADFLAARYSKDEDFSEESLSGFPDWAAQIWEGVIAPIRTQLAALPSPTPNQRSKIENIDAVAKIRDNVLAEQTRLIPERAKLRAELARQLGGKVVLVGYAATGVLDHYPTPLHASAPGITAHGTMVNGILTNAFWGRAPRLYAYLLTLALGILTTLIVAVETPGKATGGALLLIAGYILVNGEVLFDHYRVAVGAAGPIIAMGAAWAGVTLARFVLEIIERNRIQARFASYVDPEIVDYIAAHPDEDTFGGREREMTVVFTDLEGFTTLSEKLGKGAVAILNRYVEHMVPIIRRHRGAIDKFLGDGIMFECNTIVPNPRHALDAVSAVLEMQREMTPFNSTLVAQGLPALRMRVGVNTGEMIVGDAGSNAEHAKASNFTVLGDNVNLASRLEAANKAFGSLILISERTLSETEGRFAVRPMARLRVKGKHEWVMTYEPLCELTALDDAGRDLIAQTSRVFDAFVAGDFHACMAACDRMDAALGASKFTQRYHSESATLLAEGPGLDFDGVVTLREK